MKECVECQYRGYSPQACALHVRACQRRGEGDRRRVDDALALGLRIFFGAGLGVAAIGVGVAALSLGGGAALLHAVIYKVTAGAGALGGAIGLARGLGKRERQVTVRPVAPRGRRMLPPIGGAR